MENNLTRARHTVSRPSSSMSSFNTNGAEAQSLYTLPKTLSPSKHRQQNSPPSTSSSRGHSRIFSETSIPSSMQTSPRNGDGSVDVAGHTNGTSNTTVDAPANTATKQGSESRDWFWAGLTRNPTHSAARHTNYGLQPLNEDGPHPRHSTLPSVIRVHQSRNRSWKGSHPLNKTRMTLTQNRQAHRRMA